MGRRKNQQDQPQRNSARAALRPLGRSEWNFNPVSDAEQTACYLWEYSRELTEAQTFREALAAELHELADASEFQRAAVCVSLLRKCLNAFPPTALVGGSFP